VKRYLIISHFSDVNYSGGRFVAYNLILSLASNSDNEVTVWTNTIPVYQKDYSVVEFSQKIKFIRSLDYKPYVLGFYDFIILIPENSHSSIFEKSILTAKLNNSKLILYNFETPNWFNEYVKIKRDENLWDGWEKVSRYTSLIISISQESSKYAQKFYRSNRNFLYWYPPLNTFAADLVNPTERRNQIVIITRFSQSHKGSNEVFSLFREEFRKYDFKFIVGSGGVSNDVIKNLNQLSEEFQINSYIYSGISELDKFRIIAESKAMIFFSEFEGLGIPPLEALYMNTRCLSYYLAVLEETTGGLIDFCNKDSLIEKMSEVLSKPEIEIGNQAISSKFSFDVCSKNLVELFNSHIEDNVKLKSINIMYYFIIIIYKDMKFLVERIRNKIQRCLR
jgi:glycosyltransferase involved in cell wall biosynthesis